MKDYLFWCVILFVISLGMLGFTFYQVSLGEYMYLSLLPIWVYCSWVFSGAIITKIKNRLESAEDKLFRATMEELRNNRRD